MTMAKHPLDLRVTFYEGKVIVERFAGDRQLSRDEFSPESACGFAGALMENAARAAEEQVPFVVPDTIPAEWLT